MYQISVHFCRLTCAHTCYYKTEADNYCAITKYQNVDTFLYILHKSKNQHLRSPQYFRINKQQLWPQVTPHVNILLSSKVLVQSH